MIRTLMLLIAAIGVMPATAQQDRGARALALKAQRVAQVRQPRLSVVSGAEQWSGVRLTINAGNPAAVRVLHQNLAGCVITGPRLLVGNFGNASTTSGSVPANSVAAPKERQNPNSIIVRGSIETAGTKTDQSQPRMPARWGGALLTTIAGNSAAPYAMPTMVLSDAIPVAILPGASFYERMQVDVSSSGNSFFSAVSLRGGTTGFGTDSGEGFSLGSTAERTWDGGSDVPVAANTFVPGLSSTAILGTCADGSVAQSLAIETDSITTLVDDAAYGFYTGGWALRAFAKVPHMLLGLPGERGFDAVLPQNAASRMYAASFATHVLWGYGRNDLSYYMGAGGLTAVQAVAAMKPVWLRAAYAVMMPRGNNDGAPGQVFIGTTILPAPTSSDGFLTIAGQSKDTYEAGRVLFNQWMRDTGPNGFVAQANAQVAGITGAGVARVADPCAGLEVDATGVLVTDGGYSPPATQTFDSGTSSGSNTNITFNDTTKAWTVNAMKGAELQIIAGTGAGQYRSVGYNTATTLGIANAWTTTPDATSTYRITDAPGWNGVHPGTRGAILSAGGINVTALMAPAPVKISALEPWWQNGRINPAYRAREVVAG